MRYRYVSPDLHDLPPRGFPLPYLGVGTHVPCFATKCAIKPSYLCEAERHESWVEECARGPSVCVHCVSQIFLVSIIFLYYYLVLLLISLWFMDCPKRKTRNKAGVGILAVVRSISEIESISSKSEIRFKNYRVSNRQTFYLQLSIDEYK